jgi:hypothetical protein
MFLVFCRKSLLFLAALMLSSYVYAQVLPVTTKPTAPQHNPAKKKTIKKIAQAPAAEDAAVDSVVLDKDVPNFDMDKFKNKVQEKAKELNGYISLICSPQTDPDQAAKTIDQAVLLFVNEDARVEVSNANTAVKHKYKIREYLGRLQMNSSQYDNVKIKYANVSYATNFHLGADGNYHASVTFVQTFTGFIDNKIAYSDKTKRSMEVVAKKYQKATEAGSVDSWDLFLSDIGVLQTKTGN